MIRIALKSTLFAVLITTMFLTMIPALAQDPDTDVEQLTVEVLSVRPHQPDAFTQGLLLDDGALYESTGRRGESTLRRVDPETGEVLQSVAINPQIFSEGLALVDGALIQLSWTSQLAFIFDQETFQQIGVFFYEGEGWGLCYDGEFLYMSDGSSTIRKRDTFFRVVEEIPVMMNGEPVERINELECVDDQIYANVYQQDIIIRFGSEDGVVNAVVDAAGLLTEEERANLADDPDTAAVLNGIAYDPENDVFLITGKYWGSLFEVQFVPAE